MAGIVEVQDYRTDTNDDDTPDPAIAAALALAQAGVEEVLGHGLGVDEHTEMLRVDQEGYVTPTRGPVVSTAYPLEADGRLNLRTPGLAYSEVAVTYSAGHATDTLPKAVRLTVSRAARRALNPTGSSIPTDAIHFGEGGVPHLTGGYTPAVLLTDTERAELVTKAE